MRKKTGRVTIRAVVISTRGMILKLALRIFRCVRCTSGLVVQCTEAGLCAQAKTAELRLQQAQVAQRKKKKKETPEDDKEHKAAIQRKAEKEAARQRKAMLERLGNSIDLTEED